MNVKSVTRHMRSIFVNNACKTSSMPRLGGSGEGDVWGRVPLLIGNNARCRHKFTSLGKREATLLSLKEMEKNEEKIRRHLLATLAMKQQP